MARQRFKDIFRFVAGFILERPTLDEPIDSAAEGSSNCLFMGQGEPVPFQGLTLVDGKGGIHTTIVGGGPASITDVAP